MLRVDGLRGAVRLLLRNEVVPPHVTALGPGHLLLGAADDQDLLHGRRLGDRIVRVLLERDDVALPVAAVGGDDDLRLGVGDAAGERLGREAAEHDGERRADPRAGEHRDRELRDHRHIDGDPVALPDTKLLQPVRAALGLVQEVLVGEGPGVARLPLPVVRDLRALPGFHVAVEAVLRDVQLAVGEPLRVRRLPLEDLRERLPPEEGPGVLGPEALEVLVRPLVDRRKQFMAP